LFRISKAYGIIYANEPGKIILQKLGVKGKKITKKLINSVTNSIIKSNDELMALELIVGDSIYEFDIVKLKDADCYNVYGNDITDRIKTEKSNQKIEGDVILLADRNYIARELHDTVTQTLFSANLIAEVLPKLWGKDPESVLKRLDEVRMLNSLALTEMRALLFDLRPSSFKNENLPVLIEELVKSIGIKSRIPISVEVVKKYGYPYNVELSFYRIAQEALNNVVKHSLATKADLILKSLPDKISLEVVDDGIGFNSKDSFTKNLGLVIMNERAKLIEASFDIESSPGKGTKISVVYNNIGNKNKKSNYDRKNFN
jgi:signal transduction histidine kinase